MKNTRSADFCSDQIDVITKFAFITNAVIKRVHCRIGITAENCHPGRRKTQFAPMKPTIYLTK